MLYDSWGHILIPAFGVVSIFAWFYLEKYRDKSAEDWLHTNKKMAHEFLYFLSLYGTLFSAAYGFIGYGLITWVGWGGFAVFDSPPFIEFQFIVLTSTLIWSQIRQDHTQLFFDSVVQELPFILDDEYTANQAREIIVQVQGEMKNLDEIVQKVKAELKSTSKKRRAVEKKQKEQQKNLITFKQEIEQNNQKIQETKLANKDLSQVIKDTKAKNKGLELALDESMKEFKELQTMRMILLGESKKLQEDVDTVNLDIQDAFRTIEKEWSEQLKEFDNLYPAASANERKLHRHLTEEPVIKKKNDFLKKKLEEQVKELPEASRAELDLRVSEFKRKTLQDYVICEECKQPKKDGCNCGGSGPMYST